jgi:exopolysaccharide biosynthesis polyprenyl glycosylphosphotransferase
MQKDKEQYKKIILFIFSVLIMFLETLIFWFCWSRYYNPIIERVFVFRGHVVIIAVYVLLIFLLSKVYGAFKLGANRTTDIIFSQILTIVLVNVVAYLQIMMLALGWVDPRPLLVATLIDAVVIVAWTFLGKWVYRKLYPPARTLLVYSDRDPDGLVKKMNRRKDRYNICGMIHINAGLDLIIQEIKGGEYGSILLCDIPGDIRNDILKYCFLKSIRVYVTPKLSDIILRGGDNVHLFDTPLILCRNHGLSFEQKVVKRLADILLSLVALIIFMPFFILIALCIKLYDGGPVFYKQNRLTLNGKVFQVYKFRSMRMDSEKDGARLAMKNDDRVTPIGKVLRNIHVDELPQLLNILKGDMSWVGPRPERPEIAEQYYKNIPEFSFRLKVKAGLTGYAQIYGKYNTTPYDKLKLDLYYIERRNMLMDLRLLLMTVKILFQKESTEGVDSNQKTALKK